MIRLVKCIYAISILILWILSIVVLILATVIRDSLSTITLVTENTGVGDFYLKVFFPVIFPITITVACFIFVIGCVGYCGMFTNSQTLLGWFFITMLVAFCVELSAGIWRIIEYDLVYNSTDVSQLKRSIELYSSYEPTPSWFKESWAEIHQRFDCCGVESYKDWLPSDDRYHMWMTCCPHDDIKPIEYERVISESHGCGIPLLSYMSSSVYIKAMPYVTGAMGAIQILTMVLTLKIWMLFCIKTNKRSQEESVEKIACRCRHDEAPLHQIGIERKDGQTYYLTPLASYKDYRHHQNLITRGEGSSQYILNFNQVVPIISERADVTNLVEEERVTPSSMGTKTSARNSLQNSLPHSSDQFVKKHCNPCKCKSTKQPVNTRTNLNYPLTKCKRYVIGSTVAEEPKETFEEELDPLLAIKIVDENSNSLSSSSKKKRNFNRSVKTLDRQSKELVLKKQLVENSCTSSSLDSRKSQIKNKVFHKEETNESIGKLLNEIVQANTPPPEE